MLWVRQQKQDLDIGLEGKKLNQRDSFVYGDGRREDCVKRDLAGMGGQGTMTARYRGGGRGGENDGEV